MPPGPIKSKSGLSGSQKGSKKVCQGKRGGGDVLPFFSLLYFLVGFCTLIFPRVVNASATTVVRTVNFLMCYLVKKNFNI